MKVNKLKILSIVVCCFVSALWSEAQGMKRMNDDDQDQNQNPAKRTKYEDFHSSSNENKKDPVNNKMDKLELLGALRTVVSETCKSIEELDLLNDTRVMILGTTGAGKSTLIHQLVGRNVYATYPQNEKSLKLFVNPNDQIGEAFKIGHGKTSCTTNPNAYHDIENKVVWWDCPGFLDNKGIIQEFSNQLAVSKLFTGTKPSKILLVANEAKFRDRRGVPVWEAVEAIVTMFRDPNESDDKKILGSLKNSLVLIVTHAPNEFDIEYELTLLNSEPPARATNITRDIMEYLCSKVGTQCFTSFIPLKEGLVELNKRADILNTLKNTHGSLLTARQASVDPYSKQCAEAATSQMREEINFYLSVYINSVTSRITFDTPLKDLICYKEFFVGVKGIADDVRDDSEFLNKLQIIAVENTKIPDLKELIVNIINISEVHPFLLKFGAPQIEIGRSWKSSSILTLDLINNQITASEFIDKQKEKAEQAVKKYGEILAEQENKHKEQIAEKDKLTEMLTSQSESDRISAKNELEKLEHVISSSKKENEEKNVKHEAEIESIKNKEKLEREKYKNKFEEKSNNQKKIYEKKIEEERKKIGEIKEEARKAKSEDEIGVLGQIGKGLMHVGIGLDKAGKSVTDFASNQTNNLANAVWNSIFG